MSPFVHPLGIRHSPIIEEIIGKNDLHISRKLDNKKVPNSLEVRDLKMEPAIGVGPMTS